jgi:hypothetical protein
MAADSTAPAVGPGAILRNLSEWFGYATAIVAGLGYFLGLFDDPLSVVLLLLSVFIALAAFAVLVWIPGRVQASDQPHATRKWLYGPALRYGLPLAAVAILAYIGYYGYTHFDAMFDVGQSFNSQWFGKTKYHLIDESNGKPVPQTVDTYFAHILLPDDDPTDSRKTFGARFDLYKKEKLKWLRIDDVRVEVLDYQPPPASIRVTQDVVFGSTYVAANYYYAEIDRNKSKYSAIRYVRPGDKGKKSDPGDLNLLEGPPTPFMLTISAKQEGIYTIAVKVDASYTTSQRTIHVIGPAPFLFLGPPSPK